jgi:hypothetical protein
VVFRTFGFFFLASGLNRLSPRLQTSTTFFFDRGELASHVSNSRLASTPGVHHNLALF